MRFKPISLTFFSIGMFFSNLYSQNNSIRLNYLGLANQLFFEKEIRHKIPPTLSIGYERGIDSSNFSIGVQIGLGYTFLNFSSLNNGTTQNSIVGYKGISLLFDNRYYIKPKKYNPSVEGFFIGIYGGILILNENQFSNYFFDNWSPKDFYLSDRTKILVGGLGFESGYKKVVFNRIFFEALTGIGYGLTTKSQVQLVAENNLRTSRVFNLIRLELAVGYNF